MFLMPGHPHHRTHHIIRSFESVELKKRPFYVRIADALTSSFGTMFFLIVNLLVFIFWLVVNTGKTPFKPFDPFPFLLLSVAVSTYAILLSIIVLISQNRENQIASIRQELQLQVNLIAEKEITKILQILKHIASKQGIKIEDDELEEMIKQIDASYIERKLEEQMSKPETVAQIIEEPIVKIEKKVEETLKN